MHVAGKKNLFFVNENRKLAFDRTMRKAVSHSNRWVTEIVAETCRCGLNLVWNVHKSKLLLMV